MPIIITQAISDLYCGKDQVGTEASTNSGRHWVIHQLSGMKARLQRNKRFLLLGEFLCLPHKNDFPSYPALAEERQNSNDNDFCLLPTRLIGDEGQWNLAIKEFNEKGLSWFDAPWLFSECYMYRKIQDILNGSEYIFQRQSGSISSSSRSLLGDLDQAEGCGNDFCVIPKIISIDLFQKRKSDAFFKDLPRILELLVYSSGPEGQAHCSEDQFKLHIFMSLWGNQSDLSILASQHHGSALLEASSKPSLISSSSSLDSLKSSPFLLHDDSTAVFEFMKSTMKFGRIDFVLDNAGLELVSDLFLVDFLLMAFPSKISQVVLHAKKHPWFISDVTEPDFEWTIKTLEKIIFSSADLQSNPSFVERIRGHLKRNRLVFNTHSFYTLFAPYSGISQFADDLYKSLLSSRLIIMKGDLNYRKVAGDAYIEDPCTPWSTIIGDGHFGSVPTVLIKTLKSETVVGIKTLPVQLEKNWRTSGKYGVIQWINQSLE